MMRIKQIKEFNIDFTKPKTILIVDNNNVITNGLTYSEDYSSNTLVKRDSMGRIKVGDPESNYDAVNLKYLNSKIGNFLSVKDFNTDLENSVVKETQTIKWNVTSDNKLEARVKLDGIDDGKILKVTSVNGEKKFTFSSYISESTTSRSVDIKPYDNIFPYDTINRQIKDTILRIYSFKNKAQVPDVAIVSTSNDLNYSPNISFYAHYDVNTIGSQSVTASNVKANQMLSALDTYGLGNTDKVFSIRVFSDNDYNPNRLNTAHLDIYQSVEEGFNSTIIESNSKGDIIVNNGLILGNTENETRGVIVFNPLNGHFMGYNGTDWLPLDSNSGDSFISSNITSCYSIGGVKEGDMFRTGENLNDVIKKIFAPNMFDEFYIDFENAYAADNDSLEVGQPITVKEAVFSTNFDLDFAYVDGNGFDSSTSYNTSPIEATEESKSFTIEEGDYIWTIATDDDIDVTPITQTVRTFTVHGRHSVRYGGSNKDIKNDSYYAQEVIENLNFDLSDNFIGKGFSFTTDSDSKEASNFTYFAYPASWGDVTKVFMHGVPIADTFEKVGEYNYTNSFGYSKVYALYQSTTRGAYRLGTKITFK